MRPNLAATLILAVSSWAHGAGAPAPAPKVPEKPSTAAKPVVKINPYVRLVQQLYQEGKAEAALVGARSVIGTHDLDDKSLAQLAVVDGMIQVDLIEDEAAKGAFTRAFALDYNAELPPNASSKAKQVFQATQLEYRKIHAPPVPKPETRSSGDEWKWGLVGGGAAGAVAGIVVLAASNGQQGAVGGTLLGAGAATAVMGIVALSIQPPGSEGVVSLAVTPRGGVMAVCAGRF